LITPQDIHGWIAAALPCEHLAVDGDGHHFQAIIVSERFRGLNRVRQHQLVYSTLGARMQAEVHALSMQTFTPEDWAKQNG
jgi:acid stress-induced BolA-like protein IbaG/YrbA